MPDPGRLPSAGESPFIESQWKEISQLKAKLRKFGMKEHEILLLVSYYVDNSTIADITKEHGFVSVSATYGLIRRAVDTLKRRKFK